MRKKKDALDKLFVNCNKLQQDKAKRILSGKDDLSLRNYDWDVPLDLSNISKADKNRFETFIGMGRWNMGNGKKGKKFICISKRGELIYLSPRTVKVMYNSIKNDGNCVEDVE